MTKSPLLSLPGLGPTVLAVAWSECGVVTILFAMRVFTNGFIVRRFHPDFWWALTAYVSAILANVFLTFDVEFGLGAHLQDLLALDPHLLIKNNLYQWIFTTFAVISITVGKLAIISYILQIEGKAAKKARKWGLYILAGTNNIVNIILIPIIWTQCTPTALLWDTSLKGNCDGRERNELYAYFQGSLGAAVDLTLALYPIFIFWSLKLSLQIKVGLIVLFGFGSVAAVCAAIKTYNLSSITASSDATYVLAKLNIWASSEMWVVLIGSCIPTIRPLFVKVVRVTTTFSKSRTGYINQDDSTVAGTQSKAFSNNTRYSRPQIGNVSAKNESEEDILQEEGGIMMTKSVSIRYHEGT